MQEIRHAFYRLYDQSLTYPPLVIASPFHQALSWADLYADLPAWLQKSPDPSRLLELLLTDLHLRTCFLFYSFLPGRYNGGGFGRYPEQLAWLRTVAEGWRSRTETIQCLDAACGSGEGTWELAGLLTTIGWRPERILIEGWTLDPLEIYAATGQCLPHDLPRQQSYRQQVAPLREAGWASRISFTAVDLLAPYPLPLAPDSCDLILCNGLLGGPIIHQPKQLSAVITGLSGLLKPGGCLAAADRFHEGWKKQTPKELLEGLFETSGLCVVNAGEGIAGIRT